MGWKRMVEEFSPPMEQIMCMSTKPGGSMEPVPASIRNGRTSDFSAEANIKPMGLPAMSGPPGGKHLEPLMPDLERARKGGPNGSSDREPLQVPREIPERSWKEQQNMSSRIGVQQQQQLCD